MGILSPGQLATIDPRTQPGAYIHDGTHLFEVVDRPNGSVTMENCKTEERFTVTVGKVLTGFRIVKPAPKAPRDCAEL